GITVQYLVHKVYMCVDLLSLNCALQNVDTNNGKAFLNGIHSSLLVLDTIFSLYHLLKNKHIFHITICVIFSRLYLVFIHWSYTILKHPTKLAPFYNFVNILLIVMLMVLVFFPSS